MSSDSWAENNDLPDADYANLDLAFDDILEFGDTVEATLSSTSADRFSQEDHSNNLNKKKPDENAPDDPTCCGKKGYSAEEEEEYQEDYIIGTLIVRVVAARDLIPVKETGGGGGGIGHLFRPSPHHHHHHSSRRGGGVNPYASVRFGKTSQRTSQMFDTTHPTWPRGENMFMDVTHPHMRPRYNTSSTAPPSFSSSAKQTPNTKQSATDSSSAAAAAGSPQPTHPGDPPFKQVGSSQTNGNPNASYSSWLQKAAGLFVEQDTAHVIPKPERPVLTVAIFHAGHNQKKSKARYNPSKSTTSGDSDDVFLGMAGVDLTTLLTGKERSLDAWLPLQGGRRANSNDHHNNNNNHHHNHRDERHGCCGSVRIICEYEASDVAPQPDDLVRFTGYCHPDDIYPLRHSQLYKVMRDYEDHQSNSVENEDYVTVSYTSPEGWVCSAVAHRFMLVCEERHVGALEVCHDEFVSLGQRLLRSPLVHTVQDSLKKIPDEGLVSLGVSIVQGGGALFSRWMSGGIQMAIQDIVHTTNFDGHNDPSAEQSLAEDSADEFYEASEHDDNPLSTVPSYTQQQQQQQQQQSLPALMNLTATKNPGRTGGGGGGAASSSSWDPLPNMPPCPITGEPMRDPVVAADGHTYERAAIARWLQTSDKSPLTGSVLTHKNLVPNYMLVSSLQETAAAASTARNTTTTTTTTTTNNTKAEAPAVAATKSGSSGDLEEQALT